MEKNIIKQILEVNVNKNAILTFLNEYLLKKKINSKEALKENLLKDYLNFFYQKKGYIYFIYNKCYQVYGSGILKMGATKNFSDQINEYKQIYLDPIQIKYKSKKIKYYEILEKIIDKKFSENKLVGDRQFYKISEEKINETIDLLINEMQMNNIYELLIKYDLFIEHFANFKIKINELMENQKFNFI